MSDTRMHPVHLQSDDAKTIVELLKMDWRLGPQNEANIEYIPEQIMVNARVGNIFVQVGHRTNRPSSTDYQTLERTVQFSIKVSTRFRDTMFQWSEEVQRILMKYRRCPAVLGGYLNLEVTGDTPMRDLSGWYCTTIEGKMTVPNQAIESHGFGDTD